MKQPHLYNFRPSEFNRGGTNWYDDMCPRLLVLLDLLRYQLDSPVVISPVTGATGRNAGKDNRSQHNFDRWAQVRGVDFFVPGVSAHRVIATMIQLGFTGIGLYPDGFIGTVKQPRYHGDTRRDRLPGEPATWASVNKTPVSLSLALLECA
jgi:hypothetical protein